MDVEIVNRLLGARAGRTMTFGLFPVNALGQFKQIPGSEVKIADDARPPRQLESIALCPIITALISNQTHRSIAN